MNVEATLAERGSRYGDYPERTAVWDELYGTMLSRGANLKPFQLHGVMMICEKLSRIACGDADYTDNWHDIAGYARLVEDAIADGSPEGRETGSVHDSGGAESNRPRSYAQGVEAACIEIISVCRGLIGEGKNGQET